MSAFAPASPVSHASLACSVILRCAAACVVVVTAGCNDPPTVREVSVTGDTNNPQGPYEVRATVFSDDALGDCSLVVDDGARTPLVAFPEESGAREARLGGTLGGRPIGDRKNVV